ncbi:hypothetical protein [Quadrisphaera sp. DSM 44207]|uniref:hypothetical protein n=1 Tax=Quadrisphaera sp. DSM 44207 TaxID=1881057 RepID=UPI000882527D|nr:hypothetical protein [Quadrisphaera sp. DSM 44207]SDQ35918.1 hypothetical protein SAMN05428996_1392 [Quadrisphaera sp. DSM 44207]
MVDVDAVGLLTREVLRERTGDLVAEACAWSVGVSDQPHRVRRHGRVVDSGLTLGARAAAGLPLSGEEDARLELGDARPGSFQDALGALTPSGAMLADRFEREVVDPFVLDTCVRAAERVRESDPAAWAELLDDLGEDGEDLVAVVRAGEWEAPLRTEAEQLVLAALATAPLLEVEAEGLPLSLVRAAEATTRAAAGPASGPPAGSSAGSSAGGDDLAGARFLAAAALADGGWPLPVAPAHAGALLHALLAQGLDEEEVLRVLPDLPVERATAAAVGTALAQRPHRHG